MKETDRTGRDTGNGVFRNMRRQNYLVGEMEAVYHEMALKLGMSDSAMRILYVVCDSGESCLLQKICRYSGLSKQTINSALRKLETEGSLYLEPAGGKNKRVCLTEEGRLLTARTAGRVYGMENDILDAWPREDVQKYLELMERYLHDLQERAGEL